MTNEKPIEYEEDEDEGATAPLVMTLCEDYYDNWIRGENVLFHLSLISYLLLPLPPNALLKIGELTEK